MLNQVKIQGRLTSDPVIREFPNGKIVAFSIVINEKYAKNGVEKEYAYFFDVEAVGQAASVTLKKGDLVTITGSLRQDRWESSDGKRMSKVKIVAFKVTKSSPEKTKEQPEKKQAKEQTSVAPERKQQTAPQKQTAYQTKQKAAYNTYKKAA